jgi:hypothetical protein
MSRPELGPAGAGPATPAPADSSPAAARAGLRPNAAKGPAGGIYQALRIRLPVQWGDYRPERFPPV